MRLRRLEPVLRRALRGQCAVAPGSRLLVAVSGGADSSALLVALTSLAHEFPLALTAAHLHHGLRGAEADGDLEHVRALCERLGVPLIAARWNARARMRASGLSGEAGLRALRRRFLLAAAKRAGAAAIATAHTADDQLETLLMRLARGTGLSGLGGMRPRHGVWIKPLLEATRHDVERDLTRARIAWREDSSNASAAFLRNRIRHDIVPALAAAVSPRPGGPRGRDAARAALAVRAARAAGAARSGARVAARAGARALERRALPGPAVSLDARGLARLPLAVRHAVWARLWRRANPASSGLPARHREALDALLRSRRSPAVVTLPEGWRARSERGRITLQPPGARSGAGAPGAGRRRGARNDRLGAPRGEAAR